MENQNEMEIDLLELFHYLKKKIAILMAVCFLGAVVGFVGTKLFIAPKYTAATRVYVLNRSNETTVVSSDFSLANYMINDYQVLITGRNVTKEVIKQLNLDMTHAELADMISVTAPDNTRVLQISVTDISAKRAADIANAYATSAKKFILQTMDSEEPNVFSVALVPSTASVVSRSASAVKGFLLGAVLAIGLIVLFFVMDDRPHTPEDVQRAAGIPTLAVLPAVKKKHLKVRKGGRNA